VEPEEVRAVPGGVHPIRPGCEILLAGMPSRDDELRAVRRGIRPEAAEEHQKGRRHLASYKRRFCSHECLTAWRGENCSHRWVNSEGYVEITVEPTLHKDVDSNGYVRINFGTGKLSEGRVKEHRWVMEQRLGRRLLPNEEIHHKNTIRTDNDRCPNCPTRTPPPKVVDVAGKERLLCETCGWRSGHAPNLELWDGSQPRGGRVTDKMTWAIWFLSQYGQVKFTPFVSLPKGPSDVDVTTLF
jgi:hypothetical protein